MDNTQLSHFTAGMKYEEVGVKVIFNTEMHNWTYLANYSVVNMLRVREKCILPVNM